MKTQGYDITIKQGETFSIDYVLQAKDGSPYIISSKSVNPYFLLTVSSTKYYQDGRYIKNYWLEIPSKLRFYVTRPIERQNFNAPPEIPADETYSDVETYAVYFVKNADGTKKYKRWLNGQWVDYELRINKLFVKDDTIEWTGQSYVYSIDYVDGETTLQYLTNLYVLHYGSENVPTHEEELYEKLQHLPECANLIWTRALHRIDIAIPIIPQAKLSVITNIQGGII